MDESLIYRPIINRDRLILIVDPDLRICETLSLVLRLEGYQTRFVVDRQGLETQLQSNKHLPDAIVASDDLAGFSGLKLLWMIKRQKIASPIYMMLEHPDVAAAAHLMRAGANFVVAKPLDADALVGFINADLRKDIHVREVASNGGHVVEVRGFNSLSDREREVLTLVTNGRSNREVGAELGISPRTVEVHRHSVSKKLGAKNSADLVRIVLTS